MGKTSRQRKVEVQAAEISAQLRLRALIRMQEKLDADEMDALELAKDGFLRLFKDSEDRAYGTPKTSTEHTGPDGAGLITRIMIVAADDNSDDPPST